MINNFIDLLVQNAQQELSTRHTLSLFNSVKYGEILLSAKDQPALVFYITSMEEQVQNAHTIIDIGVLFLGYSSTMGLVQTTQKAANSLLWCYTEGQDAGIFPFLRSLRRTNVLVDPRQKTWTIKNVGQPTFLVKQEGAAARYAVSVEAHFQTIS